MYATLSRQKTLEGVKMKRYRILEDIMLSALGRIGCHDFLIGPNDNCELECDGHTIWIATRGRSSIQQESVTMANAIELWLKQGKIEEI